MERRGVTTRIIVDGKPFLTLSLDEIFGFHSEKAVLLTPKFYPPVQRLQLK